MSEGQALPRPVLRRDSQGEDVRDLRDILRKAECLSGDAISPSTDVVDASLEAAIRFFQQSHGLKADGIVGRLTWARLEEARWDLGDRELAHTPVALVHGRDVMALQRRLSDLGYDCGRVDGIFGPRTEGAVSEFQHDFGLASDGVCGQATIEALRGLARAITGGRAERLRDAHAFDGQRTGLLGKVIVLDPGHGDDDPGSMGHGLVERDVVADVATRVEMLLAELGAVALTTRTALVHVGPALDDEARALFANTQQADAVISLHVDSCDVAKANGVAAFYYGGGKRAGHSETGYMLADALVDCISTVTGLTNLRAHSRQWDLLRFTRMPAVRLYMGYISNPDDAALLTQDSFRDALAQGIVNAVAATFAPEPVA